jgi:hypothetical protein
MEVETDIITRIAVSPMEWAVILEVMYVKTFKNDHNRDNCQLPVCLLILKISLGEVKEINVHITDKHIYFSSNLMTLYILELFNFLFQKS